RVVLVMAGDHETVRLAADAAREKGFKLLLTTGGDAGVALAREFSPDAIVLDTDLAPMNGMAVLDNLKADPATRHSPVYVLGDDDRRQQALRTGAVAYRQKPLTGADLDEVVTEAAAFVDRASRRLLVVEDDEVQRDAIVELIGRGGDVSVTAVGSSEEALEALGHEPFDCMVLDLKLPKTTGFALLERLQAEDRLRGLPVIVYTGKELTRREETRLKKYAKTIIVKDVSSPDRLLAET